MVTSITFYQYLVVTEMKYLLFILLTHTVYRHYYMVVRFGRLIHQIIVN